MRELEDNGIEWLAAQQIPGAVLCAAAFWWHELCGINTMRYSDPS